MTLNAQAWLLADANNNAPGSAGAGEAPGTDATNRPGKRSILEVHN